MTKVELDTLIHEFDKYLGLEFHVNLTVANRIRLMNWWRKALSARFIVGKTDKILNKYLMTEDEYLHLSDKTHWMALINNRLNNLAQALSSAGLVRGEVDEEKLWDIVYDKIYCNCNMQMHVDIKSSTKDITKALKSAIEDGSIFRKEN